MKRIFGPVVITAGLVACHSGLVNQDAGADVAVVAIAVDASSALPLVPCPRPLAGGEGVGYCRNFCRRFASRKFSKHARRVGIPARFAFGTCGKFDVFAEMNAADSGVTEYFEPDGGALVGATDTLTSNCTQYGTVPSCTPALKWEKVSGGPTVTGGTPLILDDDDEDAAPPPKK